MPRTRIIWTPEGQDDFDRVCRHIAREAPRAAAPFARRLREAVRRLRDFPQLGAVVPEWNDPEFRELIQGNYRVIYRLIHSTAYIVAVRHGAQLLGTETPPR